MSDHWFKEYPKFHFKVDMWGNYFYDMDGKGGGGGGWLGQMYFFSFFFNFLM